MLLTGPLIAAEDALQRDEPPAGWEGCRNGWTSARCCRRDVGESLLVFVAPEFPPNFSPLSPHPARLGLGNILPSL